MNNHNDKIILFAGNSYSEERNAAIIASRLDEILNKENIKGYKIMGASLIAPGNDYRKRKIEVLRACPLPPSGGFVTTSLKGFLADLFSGSFKTIFSFSSKIKKIKNNIAFVFVDGDVFLFWLVKRLLKDKKVLFYVHSKSDYIEPHYKFEINYLRKNADFIFPRDEYSASNMRKQGLNALCFGSVVMEELNPSGVKLPVDRTLRTIGVLPGTRDEASGKYFFNS